MFRLRDLNFDLHRAAVTAELRSRAGADAMWGPGSPCLCWFIEVEGEERMIKEELWIPEVRCDFAPIQARSLEELKSRAIEWSASEEEADEGVILSLFVFEHSAIHPAELRLNYLGDGRFELTLAGQGTVGFDEEYGEDVELEVQCEATLESISVFPDADGGQSAEELLAEHFSVEGLVLEEGSAEGDPQAAGGPVRYRPAMREG